MSSAEDICGFFFEMESEFVWDLLPLGFMYDLYKAWFHENNPRGSVQGRNTFLKELSNITKASKIWDYTNTDTSHRPGNKMSKPEPLVIQYDLGYWKSTTYTGSNPDLIARPTVKDVYHGGLVRRNTAVLTPNAPRIP